MSFCLPSQISETMQFIRVKEIRQAVTHTFGWDAWTQVPLLGRRFHFFFLLFVCEIHLKIQR